MGRRLVDMKLEAVAPEEAVHVRRSTAEHVARMEDVLRTLLIVADPSGDRWSASMKRPDN